jgi:hypothetical protein
MAEGLQEQMMTLEEKKQAALALLTDDARLALAEWIKALGEAYMNDSAYELPSYTHPECGAEHALDGLADDLLGT